MPAPDSPTRASIGRDVAAALLGPLLVYAVLITFSFLQPPQEQAARPVAWQLLVQAAAYLVVLGGWQCLILLLVSRERPAALSLRPARLGSDLQVAALVFVLIAVANAIVDAVFKARGEVSNAQTLSQSTYFMSQDGWLLLASLTATWMLSGFEEITRAFLLSRMLRLSSGWAVKMLALVLAAALFGLVHVYEGTYGIVNATVIGLILAGTYILHGRLRPLWLAHGLFNTYLILYWVLIVHWAIW